MQFWTFMLKLYVELKVHTCFGSTMVKFISLPAISKIRMNLEIYILLNHFEMFFFYCSFFWHTQTNNNTHYLLFTRVGKASSLLNIFLCKMTTVLLIVDTSLKFTVANKYLWISVHNSINIKTCCLRKGPYQNVSSYNSPFNILSGNFVTKFCFSLVVVLFVCCEIFAFGVGVGRCVCMCVCVCVHMCVLVGVF